MYRDHSALEHGILILFTLMAIYAAVLFGYKHYTESHSETFVAEYQVIDKGTRLVTTFTGTAIVSHTIYELDIDVSGTTYTVNVSSSAYDSIEINEYALFQVYKKDTNSTIDSIQLYGGDATVKEVVPANS